MVVEVNVTKSGGLPPSVRAVPQAHSVYSAVNKPTSQYASSGILILTEAWDTTLEPNPVKANGSNSIAWQPFRQQQLTTFDFPSLLLTRG